MVNLLPLPSLRQSPNLLQNQSQSPLQNQSPSQSPLQNQSQNQNQSAPSGAARQGTG